MLEPVTKVVYINNSVSSFTSLWFHTDTAGLINTYNVRKLTVNGNMKKAYVLT